MITRYSQGFASCLRASEQDRESHIHSHNSLHRKANYVYDVRDFGAKGDGRANDTTAIQAAIAVAAAKEGVVELPGGDFVVDRISIPGAHVGLRGAGSQWTRLIHNRSRGPIVDFSTWTRNTNYLTTGQYNGFSVIGRSGDADEIGVNLSRYPGSVGVVRMDDVAIRDTGGPALYATYLYMGMLSNCIFGRPSGGHNVPYVELVASNGARMFNCGFRSLTADPDAAAGMLRLTNTDQYRGHDLIIRDCWTEYPHPSEVLIYCENDSVTFEGWSWFDMDATSPDVSWVHLAGNGNTWRSAIPGTYSQTVNPYAGIKVTGSRNRIDGLKRYTEGGGANIVLEPGASYNAIIAAGQDSGVPGNSAPMVDDNSGNTTNVLLDMTLGAATLAALDGG